MTPIIRFNTVSYLLTLYVKFKFKNIRTVFIAAQLIDKYTFIEKPKEDINYIVK